MKSYKSRWRRKKVFQKWVENQRIILTLKLFPQTLNDVNSNALKSLVFSCTQLFRNEFTKYSSKLESKSNIFQFFVVKMTFISVKTESVRTFEHFGGLRATKLSWERISWFFFSWEVASAAAQFFLLQHDDVFSASQPWTWQCFSKKKVVSSSSCIFTTFFYFEFL